MNFHEKVIKFIRYLRCTYYFQVVLNLKLAIIDWVNKTISGFSLLFSHKGEHRFRKQNIV